MPEATRDLLAQQARERGISVSSMVTEIARQARRDAIFRAEREAVLRDADAADVESEEQDWEETLTDGVG